MFSCFPCLHDESEALIQTCLMPSHDEHKNINTDGIIYFVTSAVAPAELSFGGGGHYNSV